MKDILTGIFCIAFSLFFFGFSTTFPQALKIYNSPAVYPQSLVILLFILAIILIASGIRQRSKTLPQVEKSRDLYKPLLIAATLVGYLILLHATHFMAATIIFVLVLYRLLGGTWKGGIVFAVLLTIGEYLVFGSLLKVPLP